MEFINQLFGFLETLKKSIMIMRNNRNLMALVTMIYTLIAPLFFVLNISKIKPTIFDFVTKSMLLTSLDPQGLVFLQVLNTIQKDLKSFLATELVFLLALFTISLIAQTTIILLTGVSYKANIISCGDLFKMVPQPLIRLFITSFHVTLLRVGFLYTGFFSIMVPAIVVSGHRIVSDMILWVLMILVVSLYLYISAVWVLSLVVSVLEECSGIEAVGRAGKLVKGKKLEGFLLNLLVNVPAYVFFHFLSKMMMAKHSAFTQAILLFLLMGCICLIAMFEFQAYTVLYFECKKNHGEEIELEESIEYTKIPRVPLGEELL